MTNSSFWDSQFVPYYELLDGHRQEDIPFYVGEATRNGGLVLDAGCGSGRLMLPLLQAGAAVEGFDNSIAMLEELSVRLSEHALKAKTWLDDLATFNASEERYRTALCAFNSFMHLLDQGSQSTALQRIYASLEPGGRLILDVINPHTLDLEMQGTREFEATIEDPATGDLVHVWRWFEYDLIQQIGTYYRQLNLGYRESTFVTRFRWTYPTEIELLLNQAGFRDLKVFGDFGYEALKSDSSSQVWIATK